MTIAGRFGSVPDPRDPRALLLRADRPRVDRASALRGAISSTSARPRPRTVPGRPPTPPGPTSNGREAAHLDPSNGGALSQERRCRRTTLNILGISAFYHDSAAALLKDGELDGRSSRRALHAQASRPRASGRSDEVLPRDGRPLDRRHRLRRLLRQAVHQARTHPDDLHRDVPAFAALLHQVDAGLAEGEALDPEPDREAPRLSGRGALRRAPPVPRRVGVPALALRRGRDPHLRRRRRMGHHHPGRGPGQQLRADQRGALPALARPALQRLHLLPRLQGQQRRVQGHGRRALRRAEVRRSRSSTSSSTCATTARSS